MMPWTIAVMPGWSSSRSTLADRYDRRLARVVDRHGDDYGLAIVRRGLARVTVYERPRGAGVVYLVRLRAAESTGTLAACGRVTTGAVGCPARLAR